MQALPPANAHLLNLFRTGSNKAARFPEPSAPVRVSDEAKELNMDKKIDDKLDPKAKSKKTPQADFDRNRDGLYGGLPKARDSKAPGPDTKQPHPSRH
jgi:hypothetical protein